MADFKKNAISDETVAKLFSRLDMTMGKQPRGFGAPEKRQPVHTVYGGAHLFRADTARRLGDTAIRAMQEYAPDAAALATAAGLANERAEMIHSRVMEKLKREPVEDFRLDFEDGYGNRPDAEEDGHAASAAIEVVNGMAANQLPPYTGIRIKPLNPELRARSFRTLDIFIGTLAARGGGKLPANFVVTLPKITSPAQVSVLVDFLETLEEAVRLRPGAIQIELMIETTESIFNAKGECALPELVTAARGRCRGAHFGTYDYTAACGITAAHQTMTHPACDFARSVMQVALAGTGIWLSDGATNILPVPIHRTAKDGPPLSQAQVSENRSAVHRAWKLHVEHIQHSLVNGFYQGWDLHPAQLVTRYAAVYDFFFAGLKSASERLRNFVQKAAQATLVGEVFDDAATGQGLLNYFLRAMHAGAITEKEAQERSGLTLDELRSGSFLKILENRKAKPKGGSSSQSE
jgi:citrate lyase beta subunit